MKDALIAVIAALMLCMPAQAGSAPQQPDSVAVSGAVAHPGNIIDYKVELMKPDDPIVKGLKSF